LIIFSAKQVKSSLVGRSSSGFTTQVSFLSIVEFLSLRKLEVNTLLCFVVRPNTVNTYREAERIIGR
jgi:hypothetical protein